MVWGAIGAAAIGAFTAHQDRRRITRLSGGFGGQLQNDYDEARFPGTNVWDRLGTPSNTPAAISATQATGASERQAITQAGVALTQTKAQQKIADQNNVTSLIQDAFKGDPEALTKGFQAFEDWRNFGTFTPSDNQKMYADLGLTKEQQNVAMGLIKKMDAEVGVLDIQAEIAAINLTHQDRLVLADIFQKEQSVPWKSLVKVVGSEAAGWLAAAALAVVSGGLVYKGGVSALKKFFPSLGSLWKKNGKRTTRADVSDIVNPRRRPDVPGAPPPVKIPSNMKPRVNSSTGEIKYPPGSEKWHHDRGLPSG